MADSTVLIMFFTGCLTVVTISGMICSAIMDRKRGNE